MLVLVSKADRSYLCILTLWLKLYLSNSVSLTIRLHTYGPERSPLFRLPCTRDLWK